MIEDVRSDEALADFVEFLAAGEHGEGAYRCAECRYGICLTGALPTCPMCAGTVWEPIGVPREAPVPSTGRF